MSSHVIGVPSLHTALGLMVQVTTCGLVLVSSSAGEESRCSAVIDPSADDPERPWHRLAASAAGGSPVLPSMCK